MTSSSVVGEVLTKSSTARWPVRFEIVGLCSLAWFLSYADRVNMSVAAIVMQEQFGWTEFTKGIVMAVFFIGYIASPALGGWLADKFGGKKTLGLAVLVWSGLTLLTPLAASVSTTLLIATRIALGVAEGMAVPATYALIARWAPSTERTRMLAVVVGGATLGAPCAMVISGWLVEQFSWPVAFYFFGGIGVLWSYVWLLRVCDDPDKHPRIEADERELLAQNRYSKTKDTVVPWREILTHKAVWAIVVSKFSALWTVYIFLAWLPSYFSAVQGLSVSGSGLFSAMPWIAMAVMVYVAAWIADGMVSRGTDTTYVRKLMQTIGMLGAVVFLLLVGSASTSTQAMLVTSGALAMLAFCYAGADPTVMEVAPRFSGSITGLVSTIGNLPGVIAITLTGWLVESSGSYTTGFVVAATLNLLGLAFWLRYGTAKKVID